ncbi:unnamed protein product [Kuraishia capsulata CBS 1993]|uniref:L-lactate dehydrogenase (cytochrome) n=1 Tax=Kuraishia capsulata CBS 1993 TaxID=1382522 RepID=W6MPT4_9ASCO|nr:uncharacterized protein KUCA_T00003164001 [Kuraishia capsulata CBS 1993]CDK27187.1 unnamed protein product [Kuraishia capsulata CBS 1993]
MLTSGLRYGKQILSRSFRGKPQIRSLGALRPKSGSDYRHYKNAFGLFAVSSVVLAGITVFSPLVLNDNPRVVSKKELSTHSTEDDCWISINGKVYDLSGFARKHPGGTNPILKYAGSDASRIFNSLHAPGLIATALTPDLVVGEYLDSGDETTDLEELEKQESMSNKPPLSRIFNLNDFEKVARQVLSEYALAYYATGSDDEVTLGENHNAYHRVFFKPRVLVNVAQIDTSTSLLGTPTSVPFYVSAAARAKLGHEDGELAIAKGAGREDVIQMISTVASYPLDEITAVARPGQSQWFQLYVNADPEHTRSLMEKFNNTACLKGLFITVDTACLGNRETDRRGHFEELSFPVDDEGFPVRNVANSVASSLMDTGLVWDDIARFRAMTSKPIVLKGIQCVDDVLKAIDAGVDGVVLSNHGGRNLDFSPPPLQVLADLQPVLKEKGLEGKIEIFIDGGVRRGTDILKALCLGATGVGLGRPFLYSVSGYGEAGVVKAIQILKDELEISMRLLGVTKISDLTPEHVDVRQLRVAEAGKL